MIGAVQHLNYRMCVKFSMMKMVLFLECDPKKNKTSDVPGVCFLELHSRGLLLEVWKGPLPSWGHRHSKSFQRIWPHNLEHATTKIQQMNNYDSFKQCLKTELFNRAFKLNQIKNSFNQATQH